MLGIPARAQAKRLIDYIPDDKLSSIINYLQNFTTSKRSATSVNMERKTAYEALLSDVQPVKGKPLSLNGQDEVADIIMRKYEGLNCCNLFYILQSRYDFIVTRNLDDFKGTLIPVVAPKEFIEIVRAKK